MNYRKGSFTTVPNKEQLRGKDAISQLVFVWLCSYADEDGVCFPSRKKLSVDCGVSVDTVDRKIKSLVDMGFLKKTTRKDGVVNKTNLYQLVLLEEGVAAENGQGSRTDTTRGSRTNPTVNSIHTELNPINSKERVVELPGWVDKRAWKEWVQYRNERKKSLLPSTIEKQLAFLNRFKKWHVDIIEQSIRNGWIGLFPLKGKEGQRIEEEPSELVKGYIDEVTRSFIVTGK